MIKKLLFAFSAIAMLTACNSTPKQQYSQNDNQDDTEYAYRDSTIYGFCGEGSAMNTLQLITDTGDTITVSVTRANELNKVYGGYAVGDELAILVNKDTTEATLVINKSILHGDWIMPNPIDGSSETGIRILRGGLAESIDQSSIVYKSWRIFNGKLQIQATREDGIDLEEFMVYDIVKLTPDSLVISGDEETYEYSHPVYEEEYQDGVNYDPGDESDYKI
jgi:hypothetical protein